MNIKRNICIFTALSIVLFLLLSRLFHIQVISAKNLSKAALTQMVSNSEIEKYRGDILDRNGIPFTNRDKKILVVLQPFYLKNNENALYEVCKKLDIDFYSVKNKIDINKEPMLFETDEVIKDRIMSLKIEGVSTIYSLKRYDDDSLAKHVAGYLNGADKTGETGIEKFYDDILGYGGQDIVTAVTDARNNLVKGLGYRMVKTSGGNNSLNIKLTVDYHIQKIVEKVLEENNITGAVVVEDVNTGDIAAMASKPDFNQNDVKNYLDSPGKELFNRAVASYNLGSIFKIIDTAAMLEKGEPGDYYCRGFIKIGDREFRCSSYNKGGHGLIDLRQAFAASCNTYFINAVVKTGYKDVLDAAQKFGLGKITGLKMQGIDESPGNLPSGKKYFSTGDVANISIGQGEIMATPLQVADLIATVANGGIKNRINIVDSVADAGGNKVKDLRVKGWERIISKEVSDHIKTLMEEVMATGTGAGLPTELYGGAGGKTGTAETGEYINGEKVVHAWFGGYFPKMNPRYAIAVFVENGRNGSKTAAPIFSAIAEGIARGGF